MRDIESLSFMVRVYSFEFGDQGLELRFRSRFWAYEVMFWASGFQDWGFGALGWQSSVQGLGFGFSG